MSVAPRPQANAAGTRSKSPRLRIRRAKALDEIDALEPAWRKAGSQAGNPLTQFAWTRASLSAYPDDAAPHVVAAFAEQDLVALAPLVKKRLHGVCRLFLAGAGELFEPVDLLWTDPAALTRLLRSVARGGAPLVFERIPAESLSVRVLKRVYRGRAIVMVRPQPACARISLDDRWLKPEQHLSPQRRGQWAEARRGAERLGEVSTVIHAPDLRDLPELLNAAFAVEAGGSGAAAGCAERSLAPLAHDPQRAVFYRQFAHAACLEGALRICFLRIGDRAVAVQLAVEQGGAFWLLQAGCDPRFAEYAPPLLLARETIRYAAEAGLGSYEFLNNSTPWAEPWTSDARPCVAVHVYPFGVRGMSALATDVGVAWSGR
jgi:CelD/BcsL family acetyltransferase involved in cellulose biosynthesis